MATLRTRLNRRTQTLLAVAGGLALVIVIIVAALVASPTLRLATSMRIGYALPGFSLHCQACMNACYSGPGSTAEKESCFNNHCMRVCP
jgi:uncharacterized membrane protein